ncbi:hypothetical protein KUTeg_004158 [Tegillarca granosa]|uniref:Palmitoyltransferase n=1 Tax=Tegillarca granosa TaxID=220873 RepID=A0ABQ9FQZ0_TEGGR|nr:hypothetical protein KUTeg_004158 [Tegillarca granosa]
MISKLRQIFHWGPIVALTVIFMISGVGLKCLLMWWPVNSHGGLIHLVIYLQWVVTILYNYFLAAFKGPGFVPLGWMPEKKEDMNYLQYCSFCEGFKCPRSHHCRKCDRCVMKMDHHCPWINTCCGHFNHANFHWYITHTHDPVAMDREREEDEGEFIYPYDLGWRKNLLQVFTWSGNPKSDGFTWDVVKGCDQYTFTYEQLQQKAQKRERTLEYTIVKNYSGSLIPLTFGCKVCYTLPCTDEPRIALKKGDKVLVTRWKNYEKN